MGGEYQPIDITNMEDLKYLASLLVNPYRDVHIEKCFDKDKQKDVKCPILVVYVKD